MILNLDISVVLLHDFILRYLFNLLLFALRFISADYPFQYFVIKFILLPDLNFVSEIC